MIPDLVLSGVNNGQNVADDVTYSGTVAGALEAASLGLPAIALSQAYGPIGRDEGFWSCAETHAPGLIGKILGLGIPPKIAINVNFPACQPEEVKGVAVSVQGQRDAQTAMIDERADGRGIPYYWISFTRGNSTPGLGTDLEALAHNKISVTPLKLDLTDEPALARLALVLR